MKIIYIRKTVGKEYFLGRKRWTRRSTLFKENDSIAQKNEYNGTSSSVFWSFKDTVGGTRSHGNYWRDEFSFKVHCFKWWSRQSYWNNV
jgi:hypothetical protein